MLNKDMPRTIFYGSNEQLDQFYLGLLRAYPGTQFAKEASDGHDSELRFSYVDDNHCLCGLFINIFRHHGKNYWALSFARNQCLYSRLGSRKAYELATFLFHQHANGFFLRILADVG